MIVIRRHFRKGLFKYSIILTGIIIIFTGNDDSYPYVLIKKKRLLNTLIQGGFHGFRELHMHKLHIVAI